ncbi:unnamed protein product [Hermetia illucens]|uniref:Uncharacterized protein n=1 Tax=Hermetia illucens TaxID=343691 RepID=A0A7R8UAA2_HERIL|nr:uncharacterized protein LOC119658952 [Hermetia illucens]XP_037922763.1 uncharacterized protein LOC119658952 [Hermetia illucens]CAD7076831.1 unnamed protein product [Hermetia illucens]
MSERNTSAGGSFLSPMPQERHSDVDRYHRRPTVPAPKSPTLPVPRSPAVPRSPSAPRTPSVPATRTPTAPPTKPWQKEEEKEPSHRIIVGAACKAQLQLVDKDVMTGRTYIKALDDRFQELRKNLRNALRECCQPDPIQTSNRKCSSIISSTEVKGSELIMRPNEAIIGKLDETSWDSTINSIEQILPQIMKGMPTKDVDSKVERDPKSTCGSFRNYGRGQQYGRRFYREMYGYGNPYDSDFDSDYAYDRRDRMYGRGYGRYRRGSDYYDPYMDDYYRSPRRRYGRPYRHYRQGNKKGRGKPRLRICSAKCKTRPWSSREKARVQRRKRAYEYRSYDDDSSDTFTSPSGDSFSYRPSRSETDDERSTVRRYSIPISPRGHPRERRSFSVSHRQCHNMHCRSYGRHFGGRYGDRGGYYDDYDSYDLPMDPYYGGYDRYARRPYRSRRYRRYGGRYGRRYGRYRDGMLYYYTSDCDDDYDFPYDDAYSMHPYSEFGSTDDFYYGRYRGRYCRGKTSKHRDVSGDQTPQPKPTEQKKSSGKSEGQVEVKPCSPQTGK